METVIKNEKITAGKHTSYWFYDQLAGLRFEPLRQYMKTDVVIVGGGIAGITTAYCLLKSGKKVIVVEDGFIGSGETGHSSAHLCSSLDDGFDYLENMFGEENTKLIAQSHMKSLDLIEQIVNEEQIDCGFKRVNGYLFLHPSDKKESLDKELKAASKAGLTVKLLDHVPGIHNEDGHHCISFSNQAIFHPLKYLNGLCKAIVAMGGHIFTETRAKEFSSEGIITSNDFRIEASHVVVATNTPVNDKYMMHLKQFPYRSYVIGAKVRKGSLENALWWDTGDQHASASMPPYHYVRLEELKNDEHYDLLICGGEDHATGMAEAENLPEEHRYKQLEEWVRRRFNIKDIIYKWSGQIMEPMDRLGFAGRNPMDADNIYIITGDSGNGLTHAGVGAMLITDLINGKKNPWEDIYAPSRISLKATGTFFREFVGGFFTYLRNKPDTDPDQIKNLKRDEGKVMKWNDRVCGIYRDVNDNLHVVDASCTHLKCTVNWNNDEKSWDCPCHGSRFTFQGKVMNGPANVNLDYHTEKFNTED